MDTALNLILAVLCVLVAIPLLMQIWPGVIYRRTLDADGNPLETMDQAGDQAELYEEVMSVRSRNPSAPEGTGWRREERGRSLQHYLSFLLGIAMILGAVCLAFSPAWLMPYAASALLASALVYAGRDIPHLIRAIGEGSFHWANLVIPGIAILAITAGVHLT